jgi:hypothetical protein
MKFIARIFYSYLYFLATPAIVTMIENVRYLSFSLSEEEHTKKEFKVFYHTEI